MSCCDHIFGKCEDCQDQARLLWHEDTKMFLCADCYNTHDDFANRFKSTQFIFWVTGACIVTLVVAGIVGLHILAHFLVQFSK